MKVFIITYFSLLCPLLKNEKSIKYVGHIQSCSGMFAVDRSWNLELKEKGTYFFKIKNADSRYFIDLRLNSQYSGNWATKNDTLFLYNDSLNKGSSDSVFIYRMRDSALISLGNYVDSSWGFNKKNKVIMKMVKAQP